MIIVVAIFLAGTFLSYFYFIPPSITHFCVLFYSFTVLQIYLTFNIFLAFIFKYWFCFYAFLTIKTPNNQRQWKLQNDDNHIGTKKMEYKTRQWHEKCFSCCVCKNPIGTKSFIPREQEIYCAGCYEEKYATRCIKCNKVSDFSFVCQDKNKFLYIFFSLAYPLISDLTKNSPKSISLLLLLFL